MHQRSVHVALAQITTKLLCTALPSAVQHCSVKSISEMSKTSEHDKALHLKPFQV